jgi:hypothetical protein
MKDTEFVRRLTFFTYTNIKHETTSKETQDVKDQQQAHNARSHHLQSPRPQRRRSPSRFRDRISRPLGHTKDAFSILLQVPRFSRQDYRSNKSHSGWGLQVRMGYEIDEDETWTLVFKGKEDKVGSCFLLPEGATVALRSIF